MNVRLPRVALCFFLLFASGLQAQNIALDRFLRAPFSSAPTPSLAPLTLPASAAPGSRIDTATHNRGVQLNNQGVEAMQRNQANQAVSFFLQAHQANPQETAFLNNLLNALKKSGGRPQDIVTYSQKYLALSPKEFYPAYSAGIALLEKLNRPLDALSYLEYARKLKPENVDAITASAIAYERIGAINAALELLQAAVPRLPREPYPAYLLGKILLDRRDFHGAMRVIEGVLPHDQEGYAHDLYLRARYYGNQLTNLPGLIQQVLRRFPKIVNRSILERLYRSLTPQRIRFTDTTWITINSPETLSKMEILVRMIPTIPGQQQVSLVKAEILSGQKAAVVQPSGVDTQGKTHFLCPPELFNRRIGLRLQLDILSLPCFFAGGTFVTTPPPNLDSLKANPGLSLGTPALITLAAAISRFSGDYLLNTFLAVSQGLVYQENHESYDVAWTLANPTKCDCTEFSGLFSALCLLRGYPARTVLGYLMKPELYNKETEIGHAWSEVYISGRGWVPFDATLGASQHLAYFGNKLSDQIFFDILEGGKSSRVSVDCTSSSSLLSVKVSGSFHFTYAQ
jgi:transglutaminase-like putative cysteine protease/Flp pilus assembly protein TadD